MAPVGCPVDPSDLKELTDLGAWARVVVGFAAFVAVMFAMSEVVGFTL